MHGGYDGEHEKGWTNVEWFFREPGGLWRRRRERVEQVAWTPAEIRAAFRAAGFTRIQAWDATPFFDKGARISPGCRTYHLARK